LGILSLFGFSAIPVSAFEGAHQNRGDPEGAQEAQRGAMLSAFSSWLVSVAGEANPTPTSYPRQSKSR
jgi:hypothetical protein